MIFNINIAFLRVGGGSQEEGISDNHLEMEGTSSRELFLGKIRNPHRKTPPKNPISDPMKQVGMDTFQRPFGSLDTPNTYQKKVFGRLGIDVVCLVHTKMHIDISRSLNIYKCVYIAIYTDIYSLQ